MNRPKRLFTALITVIIILQTLAVPTFARTSENARYKCTNTSDAVLSRVYKNSSYTDDSFYENGEVLLHFSGYNTQNEYVFRTQRFSYSDSWFSTSSYTYNNNLARVSLGLSFSAFTSKGFDGAACVKDAFRQMRFSKNSIKTYKYDVSLNNSDSSAAYAFAKKTLSDGSTLITVAVRGGYYGCEWADNMRLGLSYHHEGFNSAANEILRNLHSYRKGIDSRTKIKYWVVGYSRGGAIANLVAAALDEETDAENVFAYTFATPRNVNTKDYPHAQSSLFSNVFNICFEADAVPQLVMKKWEFDRYGTTIYVTDNLKGANVKRINSRFNSITSERINFLQFAGQSKNVEAMADELADLFVSQEFYAEKYQGMFTDLVYLYFCKLDREYDSIAEKYIALYGNDEDYIQAGNDLKSDYLVYALLNAIDSEYNLPEAAQVIIALGIKNGRTYSEMKKDFPPATIISVYSKFKDADTDIIRQAHQPEVYLSIMLGMELASR